MATTDTNQNDVSEGSSPVPAGKRRVVRRVMKKPLVKRVAVPADTPAATNESPPSPHTNADGRRVVRKKIVRKRKPKKKSVLDAVGHQISARRAKQAAAVYVISTILHTIVALVLAYIILPADRIEEILQITSSISEEAEAEEAFDSVDIPQPEEDQQEEPVAVETDSVVETDSPIEIDINDLAPSIEETPTDDSAKGPPLENKGEFAGRSEAGKQALLKAYGGNEASEKAVVRGLKWLASVQQKDGSWSFDKVGGAGGAGTMKVEKTAATSMALLSFLGAGHTHERGSYQKNVEAGLGFLIRSIKLTSDGGDLRGPGAGKMYAHGLATIALCEGYALSNSVMEKSKTASAKKGKKSAATRSRERATRRQEAEATKKLRQAAQLAINYVVRAQNTKNGSWGYTPRSDGDTSVVGWQVMALVSARSGKLTVPRVVFQGADHFLNSVQSGGGAFYGYRGREKKASTTAIGLLCRMYLGWKRDNQGLIDGVDYIAKIGPVKNNMYHNYYATQVLHHWGGEKWEKWNEQNRDWLIQTQVKSGKAGGSWNPAGGHSAQAGRIYQTCLCIMTLEVYYRHLPLYQRTQQTGDL
jgi:hypothetical protein